MAEQPDTTQPESQPAEFDDGLPEGGHALEVAARAGFGPLSPLADEVWHGQSVPCVSCGQLVHRDATGCEHCGQDLADDMIQKMRQHAGPWFVLEHVRPFPGVSLERVIRQIRRGLISETSIVRGPSNDYQWRFAVETPGLCRYFGKCWCCHAEVTLADAYCAQCLHYLSFEKPRATMQVPGSPEMRNTDSAPMPAPPAVSTPNSLPSVMTSAPARANPITIDHRRSPLANTGAGNRQPTTAAPAPLTNAEIGNRQSPAGPTSRQPVVSSAQSPELARLSAAVRQTRVTHKDSDWDAPPKVGGVNVAWIAALLIVGAIVALLLISRARSDRPAAITSPSLPTMSVPNKSSATPAPTAATTTNPAAAPAPNSPTPHADIAQPTPVESSDSTKPAPTPQNP